MASSRDTSNSPDWRDLASIIDSFEKQDQVTVTITLSVEVLEGVPEMFVELNTGISLTADAELAPSGCVRLKCSATNRKTLEAAILAGLYQLDFQLACNEYDGDKKKRETAPPH